MKPKSSGLSFGEWGCLLILIGLVLWVGLIFGGVALKLTKWVLN